MEEDSDRRSIRVSPFAVLLGARRSFRVRTAGPPKRVPDLLEMSEYTSTSARRCTKVTIALSRLIRPVADCALVLNPPERDYNLATVHLLSCPTSDAARTLADVLFAWSKLDPEGPSAVGRYAARGALSYLESTSILAARVFLSHFIDSALTTYPQLRVVSFPFPPAGSPLAKEGSAATDELVVTKLASLNFLQLAVRTCQVGAGEQVEKGEKGEVVKGGGRKAWTDLLKRYEREIKWLKSPEAKEVGLFRITADFAR